MKIWPRLAILVDKQQRSVRIIFELCVLNHHWFPALRLQVTILRHGLETTKKVLSLYAELYLGLSRRSGETLDTWSGSMYPQTCIMQLLIGDMLTTRVGECQTRAGQEKREGCDST